MMYERTSRVWGSAAVTNVPTPEPCEVDNQSVNNGNGKILPAVQIKPKRFSLPMRRLLDFCLNSLSALRAKIVRERKRRNALRALEALDWKLLHDIGLTQSDILDLRYGTASVDQIDARRKPLKTAPSGSGIVDRVSSPTTGCSETKGNNDFKRAA